MRKALRLTLISIPSALVALLVILLLGGGAILLYNNLVSLQNRVQNGWRQIDVQLKRRHDLIPNLVNAVKGYMGFEQKVLTDVTNARAAAGSAEVADSQADWSSVSPSRT